MSPKGLAYFVMGFCLMGIAYMLTTPTITTVNMHTPTSNLTPVRQ